MPEKEFDYRLKDSQATEVEPVEPEDFDIDAYFEYEAALLNRCKEFRQAESGIAVYRRFRPPGVFSYGCKDMKHSLALQLGGLTESMKYKADVPNFIEPWYGFGAVVSAFGLDYYWPDGQAPALKAPFKTVAEALDYEVTPIEKTVIGRRTLDMIEYFLEKTKGKIPMCIADTACGIDNASLIIEINNYMMSFYDEPEGMRKLFDRMVDLSIEFTKKQIGMIGEPLVWPGHGFSSARCFTGLGMSGDVIMMLSPQQFAEFEAPAMTKAGAPFGGAGFHSCGNFSNRIDAVKKIENLVVVDAAFSAETDPDPCPPEAFRDAFANTGIVINARIVGEAKVVIEKVKRLYAPGVNLIVVTYCKTPDEQQRAYEAVHELQ
jgi:hypothetical protein